MAALPLTRRRFTPEEYLVIERLADSRSELIDGDIYAMAGATIAHITINDNLTVEVGTQLKRTSCQGMSQNMKVAAGGGRSYVYPDYLIVCGERRFRDGEQDVLTNPSIVVEILSPSTQQYDRTTKFDLYKQIPTVNEYVLIEQDRPRVEHWRRADDGDWRWNTVEGMDATLSLDSAPVAVALRDLYDRVELMPPALS